MKEMMMKEMMMKDDDEGSDNDDDVWKSVSSKYTQCDDAINDDDDGIMIFN